MPEPLAQWTRLTRKELRDLDTAHNVLCIEIQTLRLAMGSVASTAGRQRPLMLIHEALDSINDLVRSHKRQATTGPGRLWDDRSDDRAVADYDRRMAEEMRLADAEGEEIAAALLTEDLPMEDPIL